MPYIITLSTPHDTLVPVPYHSFAVATADDARRAIIAAGETAGAWIGGAALHGAVESGGTIGPLSDGTVIEVRPIGWDTLAAETGTPLNTMDGGGVSRILAVYNAQKGL